MQLSTNRESQAPLGCELATGNAAEFCRVKIRMQSSHPGNCAPNVGWWQMLHMGQPIHSLAKKGSQRSKGISSSGPAWPPKS